MTLLLPASIEAATAPEFAIRRPTPADRDGLDAMYLLCSPESRYKRFHGGLPALPKVYLDQVLAGDPDRHDALVATAYGPAGIQIVALASAAPSGEPDTIEIGSLVRDDWQRRGVGSALLDRLLRRAAARGSRYARFELLYENGWLASVLARRFEIEDLAFDDGELSVLCSLPWAWH